MDEVYLEFKYPQICPGVIGAIGARDEIEKIEANGAAAPIEIYRHPLHPPRYMATS